MAAQFLVQSKSQLSPILIACTVHIDSDVGTIVSELVCSGKSRLRQGR